MLGTCDRCQINRAIVLDQLIAKCVDCYCHDREVKEMSRCLAIEEKRIANRFD